MANPGKKTKRISIAIDEETLNIYRKMAEVNRQPVSRTIADFLFDVSPFADFMTSMTHDALITPRSTANRARYIFEKLSEEFEGHVSLLEAIESKSEGAEVRQ